MRNENIFKECTVCGFTWKYRQDFINDDEIEIVGYQVHFKELTEGFMLFNHSCCATLAIKVDEFKDLYNGPIFQEAATGSEECPGYCLREDSLDHCSAKCECAYVREIIQILKR